MRKSRIKKYPQKPLPAPHQRRPLPQLAWRSHLCFSLYLYDMSVHRSKHYGSVSPALELVFLNTMRVSFIHASVVIFKFVHLPVMYIMPS